ncbi:MAG: class I SAM-dependent methyltransferase [Burkholderiales bacterium]
MSHDLGEPSAWVCRFAPLIAPSGRVLDVACGSGRHARYFARLGHKVIAVDRDPAPELARLPNVEMVEADLEAGAWPFSGQFYSGIVVTNYLHRPLIPLLIAALEANGVLIYETFASGNEQFGKPSNPHFLLEQGELLEFVRGKLKVVAYENLIVSEPKPAAVQRICAVR